MVPSTYAQTYCIVRKFKEIGLPAKDVCKSLFSKMRGGAKERSSDGGTTQIGRTPERWGFNPDTIAVGGMFDPNTAIYKVLSVNVNLLPEDGAWQDTIPDQTRFPGETWYYKSFLYDITVVVEAMPENITFLAHNFWAVITIRQSEVEGKQVWRIVEWRDDVRATAVASEGLAGSSGTQETRWGTIKDLYYYGPVYEALTDPDDVLENLELSYNQRNLVEYGRILDDPNFTYYFSPEDAVVGRTPWDWGIVDDLNSAGNMFDPSFQGPPITIMELSLLNPAGPWTETTPDQVQFPGETWFFKTIRYNLTVVVATIPEPTTYIMNDKGALITIRQSEFDGKQRWRIVEWHDDVQTISAQEKSPGLVGGANWGILKSMYLTGS